ncbi:helix-turn-helix transcriptional regulator [Clostridium cochlearium]|uniref:helix-turn-helix domain-containing protein n=1 Tax=Clostridium cochlearium TaxID=1494 RepID=UPI001459C199|nr:helix-turn-helix transcriptional regulator [Clostridium cochlearium]NME95319.1 helix-turn-helix transcriptional regulator [Clostridium cochlearium]
MSITGDRIKNERINLKLTQEQLGKKVHVTKQSVSKWENGTNLPEPPILNELAKLFNCTVDYLLGNTDIRNRLEPSLFDGAGGLNINSIKKNIMPNAKNNNLFSLMLEEKLKEAGLYNDNMSDEEKIELANKILDILKLIKNK